MILSRPGTAAPGAPIAPPRTDGQVFGVDHAALFISAVALAISTFSTLSTIVKQVIVGAGEVSGRDRAVLNSFTALESALEIVPAEHAVAKADIATINNLSTNKDQASMHRKAQIAIRDSSNASILSHVWNTIAHVLAGKGGTTAAVNNQIASNLRQAIKEAEKSHAKNAASSPAVST